MKLNFTKMQSLGNDFVMLNGVGEDIRMTNDIARFIADRKSGIGCDQIIVAESFAAEEGFVMAIYNQDGSKVGQCGNGARCFAWFVTDENLTTEKDIKVQTSTTRMQLTMNADNTVTVEMSRPLFEPDEVPIAVASAALKYSVHTKLGDIEFNALSMGNPHCVITVDDVNTTDVANIGKLMEGHEFFPERANIGFAQILSAKELNLRVFERGVGETLGCGSGACAAVVAGIRDEKLESEVKVHLPGGSIDVVWRGGNSPVFLRGPVSHVFKGQIVIPE